MKVLVFDTETTGLPKRTKDDRKPTIYDTAFWPHIIQLSYILYDTERNKILLDHDFVVKIPDNCELSEKSVEIHGITRERSNREGIDITEALELFNICLLSADMVVAHNISFDKQIILVECIRNKISGGFRMKKPDQFFCTMKSTTDLCRIETTCKKTGEKYFKFPRLSELHQQMFGEEPQNTHNSFVDILICLRCYIMLAEGKDVRKICPKFKRLYKNICP